MSWYDPTSWFDNGSDDKNNALHQALSQQAGVANQFGASQQGDLNGINAGFNTQTKYLQDLQNGKNSVSAEQLRQGLQQNLATQRSMASAASPQDAAMAARTAANNMAAANYGMSGQQVMAGLQERNAASQQLGNMLLGARGQNIQGANAAYGTATQGYAAGVGNPYQSWSQQNAPLISGLAGLGGAIISSGGGGKK